MKTIVTSIAEFLEMKTLPTSANSYERQTKRGENKVVRQRSVYDSTVLLYLF